MGDRNTRKRGDSGPLPLMGCVLACVNALKLTGKNKSRLLRCGKIEPHRNRLGCYQIVIRNDNKDMLYTEGRRFSIALTLWLSVTIR